MKHPNSYSQFTPEHSAPGFGIRPALRGIILMVALVTAGLEARAQLAGFVGAFDTTPPAGGVNYFATVETGALGNWTYSTNGYNSSQWIDTSLSTQLSLSVIANGGYGPSYGGNQTMTFNWQNNASAVVLDFDLTGSGNFAVMNAGIVQSSVYNAGVNHYDFTVEAGNTLTIQLSAFGSYGYTQTSYYPVFGYYYVVDGYYPFGGSYGHTVYGVVGYQPYTQYYAGSAGAASVTLSNFTATEEDFTAVPEPSTYALLGALVLGGAIMRRRQSTRRQV